MHIHPGIHARMNGKTECISSPICFPRVDGYYASGSHIVHNQSAHLIWLETIIAAPVLIYRLHSLYVHNTQLALRAAHQPDRL